MSQASLCGHYEVVQLLLESGALCERDTFSGERCLYNALTDKIRVLLLKYDYSKSTDPLQPLASHITGLLHRAMPDTSDITLGCGDKEWKAHKFLLAARSPYFSHFFGRKPQLKFWTPPEENIPTESFGPVIRYLYFGDIPTDLGLGPHSNAEEQDVLKGVETLARQWQIAGLWEGLSADEDRKTKMKRQQDDVSRGARELENWFRDNVLGRRMVKATDKVDEVKWTHDNECFADVILSATAEGEEEEAALLESANRSLGLDLSKLGISHTNGTSNGTMNGAPHPLFPPKKTVLYPCHKALLLRSEYFHTMFTSAFLEAQPSSTLRIINVDCPPEVLEIVLTFLYTEKADFGLDIALDVLYAADMLLIEKLKNKAAIIISSLGSGKVDEWAGKTAIVRGGPAVGEDDIDIVEILKAAWLLNVQRLEEFAGRYLAYRLENYIDEPVFQDLIKESASRVKNRQETDTIELLDDIRYYLSERFRLRFEDLGLHEMGVNLFKEAGRIPKSYGEKEAKRREEERKKAEKEGLKTLGGEVADDEFSSDAINYQVLLDKLDGLLEKLKLDA